MFRILLVDQNKRRSMPLKQALEQVGYEVVGYLRDSANLNEMVQRLLPDVVIIDTDSPGRDTLEHIVLASRDDPRPIVMFTYDGDTEKIRTATRAGVSAYVVGGLDNERIRPILDAAIARFEEYRAVRSELAAANFRLSERKLVERAKGVLMKRRGLGEEEAYRLMRKVAMDRNMRLSELARQVIEAANLLF